MFHIKKKYPLFIYLAQLIEYSKFKNAGHIGKGEVLSSSHNETSLLYCNKLLSYKKKQLFYKMIDNFFFFKLKLYIYYNNY